MNLPNKLTLGRVILVPIFMLFLLLRESHPVFFEIIALFVFIVAAITDGLDGYLARKQQKITKFGKILDPLADKLLISAALISFVALGEISAWPAIIIIGRELAVTGLRVISASEGKVIAASKWGKWKTGLQIAAVIAVIIDSDLIRLPLDIGNILLWIAVIITIISGIDYFTKTNIDFFHEEKG
ncbi:CDP-diacylglycerol--glycerol-3-phosphate 3-phosphatidyltransferase [Iocasia frigidifontis]|uniref:CDP-diacylglycerol--glycerol-3-phosphate 3-phosphatidyltransferase n=1 Tax=Iocasia fonsfrigidae TaxID=2682810 RepID=A0A8A7KHJ4_9FIRM|nr:MULTISPECIES: CDP-diacylglycerol--glycerol-3-phosphate 3-phosphatidyltransferase [Halanaerobiaceae]AZO95480.1 CDP-diacylglycerol--glycerol-3-phosphate 3-phosphatidyltransferase [Halocella sp. SP3-1]QTL98347.1 CDP-diacylglycerol--glycerol-3-phosphate 3-phosphatidyltransferase [Iocasia fonsfrigidae]